MAIKRKGDYSVLMVLTSYPLQSPFLTDKLVLLNEYAQTDIIAWDSVENKKAFQNVLKEKNSTARVFRGFGKLTFSNCMLFVLINLPYFILKASTISRFLREGRKAIGNRIYKRLFLDFEFIKSKHSIWHFEFGHYGHSIHYLKNIFPDKKFVLSFRGYDINYIGLSEAGYYDDVWKAFDGFHFLGNDLKERAIQRGYKQDKVEATIPPAVDTSLFITESNRTTSKEKLIIISVGRLNWKKGYEYGIRAAKLLKDKNIPVEYRIIGDGEHLQALQFTASEIGIANEVKILGHRNQHQVKEELSQAMAFLHPAISEGFCNAVIEAQAMGLPVVCTDADGLRENIENSITGFVVPKWDIEQMAEKLEWVWNNKEQAKEMGKAGIARVNKYFTQTVQIKQFDQFYKKVNASG